MAHVREEGDSLSAYRAEMVHAASASQRLFETPIPMSYTRHTSRSLMLWLLSLPFALWSIMGTSMVPACLVISYVSAHIPCAAHKSIRAGFCPDSVPYACDSVETSTSSTPSPHMCVATLSTPLDSRITGCAMMWAATFLAGERAVLHGLMSILVSCRS